MAIAPTYALNDGTQLPAIGFGTSPMDDAETETAVREAVRLGYRLVDTASRYGNEAGDCTKSNELLHRYPIG